VKLKSEPRGAGPLVTGFAGAGFKIDGEPVAGGVLLTPETWRPWNAVLDASALEPLTAIAPEFIIIGTGARLTRPPRDLVALLEGQGIGIEAMDSRAGARAWSVLRAEGRWIAAALMPLG
jgi:uncharacterized protein